MNFKLLKLIIMASKLTLYGFAIQCILLTTLLASSGNAQQIKSVKNVYIDLEVRNADLIETFQLIELKTDFKFAFDNQDLEKYIKVSIVKKNISVADVLLKISEKADLKFRQVNNYINVDRKEKAETPNIEIIIEGKKISGKVVSEEDDEGLPGVNVLVKGTSLGTVTDAEGEFELNVPEDATTLVVSFVGYIKEEIAIGNMSFFDVRLVPD
ncbi:MAG: carboxypeptidase-like regulatory domain-containing protein, partial [Cyclobacteriaceae bacterium]|nr:carboxypeptidase-like regulatory domain-containing protein [Cyclobacteriaceae bacterium]